MDTRILPAAIPVPEGVDSPYMSATFWCDTEEAFAAVKAAHPEASGRNLGGSGRDRTWHWLAPPRIEITVYGPTRRESQIPSPDRLAAQDDPRGERDG